MTTHRWRSQPGLATLCLLGVVALAPAPTRAGSEPSWSDTDDEARPHLGSNTRVELSGGLFVTGEGEFYTDTGLAETGFALALQHERVDRWMFVDARVRRGKSEREGDETFELRAATQWIVPLAVGVRQSLTDLDRQSSWPFDIYAGFGLQLAWVLLAPPPELSGQPDESTWSGGAFFELRPEVMLGEHVSLFLATRASALTPVRQVIGGEVTLGGVDAQFGAAFALN